MVVFACNHCGESLKKQVVERHSYKCRRNISVSCMDCMKDFFGNSFEAHTSCITEAEKYSGKDYVPKENKGAKKQESWISTIRSITEKKTDLPKGMMDVLEVIKRNDNIPKKMKGFLNFFQNSAKQIRKHDVEAVWAMIDEEVKRCKQEQQASSNNGQQKPAETTSPKSNGADVQQNSGTTKRKAEVGQQEQTPKRKKESTANGSSNTKKSKAPLKDESKSTNGTHEQVDQENNNEELNDTQKFKWNEVIRNLLSSKNNSMQLAKLKKKVHKKYLQQAGGDAQAVQDAEFEKKFNKKLRKAKVVVENDTVRLIE